MLKKMITTAVLGVSALSVMAANAATPGVYATGQLGYADTHMKNEVGNLTNNGLAGRLAIGYQFNQTFAVEMGYLRLHEKKADVTLPTLGKDVPFSLNQNAIDLAGKGILPVAHNVNVYGKLGVAYLTTSLEAKADIPIPTTPVLTATIGHTNHKWVPEAAVGVSYDITPNVSVDTSWTHIQPIGNDRPGNIDFVAVGVGYNFG
jgi:OmpA-OmpF porin, OOP family